MPTIFRTNNPTKLQRLDNCAVSLRVTTENSTRSFFIEKIDQSNFSLPIDVRIACLATAGQTVQYFELGTLGKVDHGTHVLSEIGEGSAIRFRVMFYDPVTAKILASADNLRSADELGPAPSLISIQPTTLNGPVWELELPSGLNGTQPTLLVEQKLFPFSKAVVTDVNFMGFVLPEVVRQIATCIVHLDVDEESDDSWALGWLRFFTTLGLGVAGEEDEDKQKWVGECVKAFCSRGNMLAILEKILQNEGGASK